MAVARALGARRFAKDVVVEALGGAATSLALGTLGRLPALAGVVIGAAIAVKAEQLVVQALQGLGRLFATSPPVPASAEAPSTEPAEPGPAPIPAGAAPEPAKKGVLPSWDRIWPWLLATAVAVVVVILAITGIELARGEAIVGDRPTTYFSPKETKADTDSRDTEGPRFVSASASGREVVVTFNESLDLEATIDLNDFTLIAGTEPRSVVSARAAGRETLVLVLDAPIAAGTPVLLRYEPSENPIRDEAGNAGDGFSDTVTVEEPEDQTPPAFVSAAASGDRIVLTFDEALDATSTPDPGDFKVSDQTGPLDSKVEDISENTVTLLLAKTPDIGTTITVDYTPTPGHNPIQDEAGNAVVDDPGLPVPVTVEEATGDGTTETDGGETTDTGATTQTGP